MITTADEIQRNAYQSQIDVKKEKKELPINLEIYIVSDPPGPKLGKSIIIKKLLFLLLKYRLLVKRYLHTKYE